MGLSSDLLNAPKEFLQFFKAGKEAAKQGDKAKAHALFRKAIEIDPYHEQVWLWLASVVETDDDRRVCFENVLELNPSNPTARMQLRKLAEKAIQDAIDAGKKQSGASRRRTIFRLALLVLIIAASTTAAAVWGLI